MLVFTGLDYANCIQGALDRSADKFDTELSLATREALVDELETSITRQMLDGDLITGAGVRRAMELKAQYLARWAFAYDHEHQRYRWIDTTGRHAAIALEGCTILIPHNA